MLLSCLYLLYGMRNDLPFLLFESKQRIPVYKVTACNIFKLRNDEHMLKRHESRAFGHFIRVFVHDGEYRAQPFEDRAELRYFGCYDMSEQIMTRCRLSVKKNGFRRDKRDERGKRAEEI